MGKIVKLEGQNTLTISGVNTQQLVNPDNKIRQILYIDLKQMSIQERVKKNT